MILTASPAGPAGHRRSLGRCEIRVEALERHGCEPTRRAGPQKFTEPVALSSSEPGDFPLPRTVSRLGLDLLALRARCEGDTTAERDAAQECRRKWFALFA